MLGENRKRMQKIINYLKAKTDEKIEIWLAKINKLSEKLNAMKVSESSKNACGGCINNSALPRIQNVD